MALPLNQLPVIKRGWQRALVFCVAYLGMLLLTGMIAGAAIGIKMNKTGASDPGVNTESLTILILFIGSFLGILLTYLFRRFIDLRSFNSIGLDWKKYRSDAWVGFLLAPAILGLGSLILFFNDNLHWTDAKFIPGDFFIALILTMIIALGEEIAFRGYILNNLMESLNKWVALGISALIFTVAHAMNPHINSIAVINLLLGGILLGLNYIYTRNLWFSILFHFSWNFFQGPLLGYEVSGIGLQSVLEQELSGNLMLTGNSFGFEGSVINIFLAVPVLFVLFMVYENRFKKTASTVT